MSACQVAETGFDRETECLQAEQRQTACTTLAAKLIDAPVDPGTTAQ